jgi:hypothetical protein
MLAVDGQQRGAAGAHRLQEQVAAHHQRFLVGQQQALAGAGRRQAGRQAGGADDGGHHGVDRFVRRRSFPAHLLAHSTRVGRPVGLEPCRQRAGVRPRPSRRTAAELHALRSIRSTCEPR